MNSITSDSKLLSLILRHAPEKAGLSLSKGGWVGIDALLNGLSVMGRNIDRERLEEVVTSNDKKRFTISEDGLQIRAAQGHSVDVALKLQPKSPPVILHHGTAKKNLSAILAEGLKPMSRQQVHLSTDRETAIKVGSRHGKPFVLTVLSGEMEKAGFKFYQADNGVWLTDAIPNEYLTTKGES